jgi:hypothetical protein
VLETRGCHADPGETFEGFRPAGPIINALDGEHAAGHEATNHIFAMKDARFTFGISA